MKNSEVISARLYPYDVDANKVSVAKAAIDILKQLIVLASEGNGGYSIGYNVEELRRRIHALAKDNGLTDIADEFNLQPTVKFL